MKGFRKHSEFGELERELRGRRPEPQREFLNALANDVAAGLRATRIGGLRIALAAALSLVLIASFAAFGGLSYAASTASHQAKQVAKLTKAAVGVKGSQSSSAKSPSSKPGKGKSTQASGNNGHNGDDDDDDDDADDDQYKPGKGCGDKNHIHERENECKKPPK